MVVRDDNPGAVDVPEHVPGYQLSAGVVAVGVVGLKHAQPVFDRDARSHDQETPRETPAVRVADRVDRLPRDDHGHDGRLAGAGGQLQGQTRKLRVGVVVGVGNTVEKAPSDLPELRRNLGQPDSRLDRLDLAEEGTDVAEVVVPPMLEQASGFRRDAPVVGVRQASPLVDVTANLIHHLRDFVLLLLGGQPLALVKDELLLTLGYPALPGLRDRSDEVHSATGLDDPLGRLTLGVQLPVPGRGLIGRV